MSENPGQHEPARHDGVEMPRPTVAPFVLSLGMVLLAAGAVTGLAFLVVGVAIILVGLGMWVADLLPGKGHVHEPLVEPARRARVVTGLAGTVEQLQTGMPGYRLRMPEKVHPISAGIKGGIVGGVVMPLPALLYGWWSGKGIWLPVNLLAGMVLPGMETKSLAELGQFHSTYFIAGAIIHVVTSVVLGLIYGVLLPTLPDIPRPLAWGGLLMPILWTAVSFSLMGVVNPVLHSGVDWPWFILSQFVFGIVAALVVIRAARLRPIAAGILGGLVGGLLMAVPAFCWGLLTRRGMWYPVNLLAGMVLPGLGEEDLEQFRADWFAVGLIIHAVLSLGFGVVYGLFLPKLRPIPAPVAWGGLVLPLLWTAMSYGLLGVVNPVLQQWVDWPWFVVSQFVFGLTASVVVLRTEEIHIPPAGQGPDSVAEFVIGPEGRA